jgi:hypothetical protein
LCYKKCCIGNYVKAPEEKYSWFKVQLVSFLLWGKGERCSLGKMKVRSEEAEFKVITCDDCELCDLILAA